jgi:hypothetical protein
MARTLNRYGSLIEKVFFDRYQDGATSLDFTREDIEKAASPLGLKLPKNLGDVLYSFRFRNALPERIVATLDLSRICAAPSARLSHLSFKSDRTFPAQS